MSLSCHVAIINTTVTHLSFITPYGYKFCHYPLLMTVSVRNGTSRFVINAESVITRITGFYYIHKYI